MSSNPNHYRNSFGRHFRSFLFSLVLSGFTIVDPCLAQPNLQRVFELNYPGVNAAHNYSIVPAQIACDTCTSKPDAYVTAGTLFNECTGIGEAIHFIRLDQYGNPMSCGGGLTSSYIYDVPSAPGTVDTRLVTLFAVPGTDNTVLVIQNKLTTGTQKAWITLLIINNCSGNISLAKDIALANENIYVTDGNWAHGPHNFVLTGYKTDASGGDKRSFAILYSHFYKQIWNAKQYNTTTTTILPYDYDMGLHIRTLGNTSSNYDYFISGSCNADNGSASLAMRINYSSLNVADIMWLTDVSTPDHGEYSFDVRETVSGFYLYSNKYDQTGQSGTLGFIPQSKYPAITFLLKDAGNMMSLYNGGINQRYHIKSPNANDTSFAWGAVRINATWLTGVQVSSSGCTLNGTNAASPSEPVPFLAQITPSWSGTTFGVTINRWKSYPSQLNRTLYPTIGGQMSNISWPTKFGTANTYAASPATTDMTIMASTYTTNERKFKFIRTDLNGDINAGSTAEEGCDTSVVSCVPTKVNVNATGGTPNYTVDTLALTETETTWFKWQDIPIHNTCAITGIYKPSDVTTVPQGSSKFIVFPNPTNNYVQIELNGALDVDREIKAEIVDIMGKVIANLYEGPASDLSRNDKLNFGSLATGVYILRITSQGETLHQEKLSILQ